MWWQYVVSNEKLNCIKWKVKFTFKFWRTDFIWLIKSAIAVAIMSERVFFLSEPTSLEVTSDWRISAIITRNKLESYYAYNSKDAICQRHVKSKLGSTFVTKPPGGWAGGMGWAASGSQITEPQGKASSTFRGWYPQQTTFPLASLTRPPCFTFSTGHLNH